MKRSLARVATIALAIPFAVGVVAGAAQAQTLTVPVDGCYGAGSDDTIVCDLAVSVTTPEPAFSVVYVKACAGSCYNVPVTWAGTSTDTHVCYTYQDGAGNPYDGCATDYTNIVGLGGTTTLTNLLKDIVLDLGSCGSGGAFCTYE